MLAYLGGFFIVAGLVSVAHGGVALLVLGGLLIIPFARERLDERRAHRQDLADAAALARGLRSGELPPAVEPATLHAAGQGLEPGEVCFIDGATIELFSFYGDPFVQRDGFFFAFGGPLAWFTSILGTLAWRDHNKRKAKKAAPRWRDPEAGRLWVTDKRYILHALTGNRDWVQIPWDNISQSQLEKDGVVIALADMPGTPMKVRLTNPAWHYVLLQRLAYNRIEGRPPVTSVG